MTLPQNKAEWEQACATVVAAMQSYVAPSVTPLSAITRDEKERPTEGKLLGTGSYLEVASSRMLITNEHNLKTLEQNSIGAQFFANEGVFQLHNPAYTLPYPWDVGFSMINLQVWTMPELNSHKAVAIPQGKLAPAHRPVENELLFLMGYASTGSTFLFGTLLSRGTSYLMREVALPKGWGDTRFHFALDYRPDLAEQVGPGAGLPRPDGLSGSLVWNTRYVECVTQGKSWLPEYAEVTGIVWGWPSSTAALIATRIEHVRSFMLHVVDTMITSRAITLT